MVKKPSAPYTISSDGVAKDQPQRHKSHPRFNIHPPQHRPGHKYRRYRRKSELKINQSRHRKIRHRRFFLRRTVPKNPDSFWNLQKGKKESTKGIFLQNTFVDIN